jgi:RNA polymerase sigma-70 factor (ECF subfamily)
MMPVARTPPEDDPESSADLLLKAQTGDENARNDLIGRYLPRLDRWASGRLPLGVRTLLDTGDIVQETVMNALPRLNMLEVGTEKALEVYLKRSIQNRIIDVYRRPRRTAEQPDLDIPARRADQVDATIGAEALERYERALESLTEHDRQLIVMHVELGFNHDQIAAEIGKSPGAARTVLAGALTRLAVEMQRTRGSIT